MSERCNINFKTLSEMISPFLFCRGAKCSSACHLEFVVALTRGVPRVIWEYFPLSVGKCIPDAHSFAVYVPSSFSLIGRAAGSPGETCRGRQSKRQIPADYHSVSFGEEQFVGCFVSYQLGRCRSRKTSSHSSSSQSHHWLTHTAPVQAHGTAAGCTAAASWSLARSSQSSVKPKGQELPNYYRYHGFMLKAKQLQGYISSQIYIYVLKSNKDTETHAKVSGVHRFWVKPS